jgi:hypothetical protein
MGDAVLGWRIRGLLYLYLRQKQMRQQMRYSFQMGKSTHIHFDSLLARMIPFDSTRSSNKYVIRFD